MKGMGRDCLEEVFEEIGQAADVLDLWRRQDDLWEEDRLRRTDGGNLLEREETVQGHEIAADAVRHP